MDPIKVDFSGKGSDRSKEIVIPPEKAALKIVLSVVFALLTGAIVYYFMLPPLNPKAIEFYYFIAIVIGRTTAPFFFHMSNIQTLFFCLGHFVKKTQPIPDSTAIFSYRHAAFL